MARLVAPLALIAFAVIVVAMVLGSGVVGDDENRQQRDPVTCRPRPSGPPRAEPVKRKRAAYTIKANDTLSGIAAHTGRRSSGFQELNPELDPQGLVAGQKIKLRE